MENKILIHADINLNVVDGATIWWSNTINVFIQGGIDIIYISNYKITNDSNLRNIENKSKLTFINPDKNLNPTQTLKKIEEYGNQVKSIILRSNLILEIINKNWNLLSKTIIYGLDIHLNNIKKLNNKFKKVWTQSEKLKKLFEKNEIMNVKIVPVIAYKYDFNLPERTDNEVRLIYTGTLRNEENIIEIIKEFKKIHKERPEVVLKIVYGKIHGDFNFVNKINTYIKTGVNGITFKNNLSHKDTCYEIATSDIGICWRKNGWGDNGQVSTKVKEYETYGIQICYTLNSNLNIILDKYKINTYVLTYDDYECNIFKNNLIFKLNYQFINGNYNDKIAEDILNNNLNNNDFFKDSIYSNSKIKLNNQYGHVNAMINILNDAIKNNYENILILEYDVHFHVIFPSILNDTINKLEDYSIIYLGSSKHNNCIIDHSKNIYKGMTGTFAIILNKCTFYDFKDKLEQKLYPSDLCLIKVCEKYKPYVGIIDSIISNIENSSILLVI